MAVKSSCFTDQTGVTVSLLTSLQWFLTISEQRKTLWQVCKVIPKLAPEAALAPFLATGPRAFPQLSPSPALDHRRKSSTCPLHTLPPAWSVFLFHITDSSSFLKTPPYPLQKVLVGVESAFWAKCLPQGNHQTCISYTITFHPLSPQYSFSYLYLSIECAFIKD